MPQLVAPTTALHASWLAAEREWPGSHQAGAGLHLTDPDGLVAPAAFTAWVARLRRTADEETAVAGGTVPTTYLWITEDGEYRGCVDLRHRLDDFMLAATGHVGYSVRPSARGRGLATWALGAVLPRARRLGLDRVLVTCDEDNAASARVIERNGGVLEEVRTTAVGTQCRYWIASG